MELSACVQVSRLFTRTESSSRPAPTRCRLSFCHCWMKLSVCGEEDSECIGMDCCLSAEVEHAEVVSRALGHITL